MKYDITAEACRVCLRKSASCRSIFDPLPGDVAPNVKLNLLAGVMVNENDSLPILPKCICKQCEIAVNTAFNLRKRARKSDQILSVYCNKVNKDNIIVELSNGRKFKLSKELTLKVVPVKKIQTDNNPGNITQTDGHFEEIQVGKIGIDDDDRMDDSYNDDVKDIDHCHDDDFKDFEYPEPQNESDDDDDDNNDDVLSIDCDDEKISPIKNIEDIKSEQSKNEVEQVECKPNIQSLPAYNIEEIAKKINASNQYELISWKQDGDPNSVPTIKLRVKDPPEKPLSKDFICDVCGNTYTQKHRLMEHMRRHNPEKLFSCEFCSKSFAVAEGLRRHVLTHGAKKPFKCHFCTRCFFTPSARKAHEKVHSGARPYLCKVCDQNFAYSSSLRKHTLIHENKKLYRCEYCDKDFRLQHHMKQHEETQIHKDAVAKCKQVVL